MRYVFLLTVLLAAVLAAPAADPNPMLYQRVSTGSTPVIDGKISPNEWNDAAVLPPFARVKGGSPLWTKLNRIMLKFDRENLYIGFRTHMAIDMALAPVPDDSNEMSNVESFDIRFVLPGQAKWKRFMVERGGKKFDQLFRGHKLDNPGEWNPEWTYKCRLIPQEFTSWSIWEGEIAIPWRTLEMPYPEKGVKISALFIRNLGNVSLATDDEGRLVSWAPVSNKTDLIFDANYGGLMLEPEKPVFRMDSLQNFSRSVGGVKGRIVGQQTAGGKINSAIWDSRNPKRMFDYTDNKLGSNTVAWQKNITVKQAEPANGRIFIYDAAGGVLCKYPFHVTILPPFYSEAVWNSTDDTVRFAGQSLKGFQEGDRIKFTLSGGSGVYASKTVPAAGLACGFDGELSAAAAPAGAEVTAVAALLRGDQEVAASKYTFKKQPPQWHGALKGFKVETPPPGWASLKIAEAGGKITASVRDHAYIFGASPLPEEILLHQEKFSAGAWEFTAETSAGLQHFTGAVPKITSRDDRGITLKYSGDSAELTLDADIRVEFDGLAWYRCRFTPRQGEVTVKHLAISCPVAPERLRYLRSYCYETGSSSSRYALIGSAKRTQDLPPMAVSHSGSVSGTGWKYQTTFNYFYWISGEDRGCMLVLPSMRNLSIDTEYNRVIDEPGKFRFSLELVNKTVKWTSPADYEFGIVLTPARQAPNPAALRRLGQYPLGIVIGQEHVRQLTIPESVYTNDKHISWRFPKPPAGFKLDPDFFFADMIGSWVMRDVMDGNFRPAAKEQSEIRRQCAGIRKGNHGKPMLWYDMLVTPPAKDLAPFLPEWCIRPVTNMPADVFVTVTCPASSGWKEAYLYGVSQRMKDGVCSFYADMSSLRPCRNRMHGCGYYDAQGELKPALPFLQFREFILMLQNGIKKQDPDGIFFYHGSGPMNLWCDAYQECEYWQYAPDYSTMTPEFVQLEMPDRRQTGAQPYLTNSLCYRHVPGAVRSKMPQLDSIGLMLLHDSHCYNTHALEIYGNYLTTKPLLDFGADAPDCRFVPYWRNPRSLYPGKGRVAVSSYLRGGRELAVIFNVGSEVEEIDITGGVVRFGEADAASGVFEAAPRTLYIIEFPEHSK